MYIFLVLLLIPAIVNAESDNEKLGEMIDQIYQLGLGLAVLLAVLMIAAAGFKWATSQGVAGKVGEAKSMIKNALIGLALGFCAVMILSSINPSLTDFSSIDLEIIDRIDYKSVEMESFSDSEIAEMESSGKSAKSAKDFATAIGAQCDPSLSIAQIAESFLQTNKIKYAQNYGKNVEAHDPNPNLVREQLYQTNNQTRGVLDCSSFAKKVLNCAGINIKREFSAALFGGNCNVVNECTESNGETYINGKKIPPGTRWGWNGHVLLFVGGTTTYECYGVPKTRNKETGHCISKNTKTCAKIARSKKEHKVCFTSEP